MNLYNIAGKEKGGWSNRSIINVIAASESDALQLTNIDLTQPYQVIVSEITPRVITTTRM